MSIARWEGKRNEERSLVHISNFRPVKRVQDCVRILEQVRREIPAHLYMVGDGPERGPAERLAIELGLESHVTFMGKQDHIHRLLPGMDVLLLPSELESFGLAALEAMACGVPPVATNVGGVPELITSGVDGFLEPVGDIAAQAAESSSFCQIAHDTKSGGRGTQNRGNTLLHLVDYSFVRGILSARFAAADVRELFPQRAVSYSLAPCGPRTLSPVWR